MRWALVLAVLFLAAGCRRTQAPQPRAEAPAAPPSATSAAPPAEDAPVAGDAEVRDPSQPEETAAAPVRPGATDPEKLPVVDVPPPTIAQATPNAAGDERDDRIYTWTDRDGVTHFGRGDEVPDSERRSARLVDAGVTVVPNLPDMPSSSTDASSTVRRQEEAGAPAERRERGPEPQRDEQGLPVPGTMDDTAATRAARAAGETQIDPAAVERRREEELRRMNCREKDGAWFCD